MAVKYIIITTDKFGILYWRIYMKNCFKKFGVMIDLSRNAVMTVSAMKNYLTLLKKMGYNCAFLYMEDTYTIEGEPYFGYLRGRYTEQEMREIDTFADSIGLEIVPCVQTLAHLATFVRWKQVPVDCDDILLAGDDRTYEFVENMFKSLSKNFKTRNLNIGMDEAHMLGRGKYADINGHKTVSEIMKEHLDRISEIADKYGYNLMIWSDMYVRPFTDGKYYVTEKTTVPKEIIANVPKNITPIYWDYYHTSEELYDYNFDVHKQLKDTTWFAGGAWTWSGFMPDNNFTIRSMKPAFASARRNGVKNVILTMWGDCGGECSRFSVLPSLLLLSEYAKGNNDMVSIKAKFKRITGIDYDDFILLDELNYIVAPEGHRENGAGPINPSKYMLYNDYFNGLMDVKVTLGDTREKYEGLAAKLYAVAKKSRTYGHLFNTAAKLADVLAIKFEVGVKTRAAYKAGDKDELLRLAKEDYTELEKRIKAFADAYEKQWFVENNPNGFDIQDLRLGGLLRRTMACRRRLVDYVTGKVDAIPELDVELIPYNGENGIHVYEDRYPWVASSNAGYWPTVI